MFLHKKSIQMEDYHTLIWRLTGLSNILLVFRSIGRFLLNYLKVAEKDFGCRFVLSGLMISSGASTGKYCCQANNKIVVVCVVWEGNIR